MLRSGVAAVTPAMGEVVDAIAGIATTEAGAYTRSLLSST